MAPVSDGEKGTPPADGMCPQSGLPCICCGCSLEYGPGIYYCLFNDRFVGSGGISRGN